jgi:uncharacterized protein YheU (UPF0270 family)
MDDNIMNKFISREGENNTQHERSGRFYHTRGNWFFKTREGFDYGPYQSKTECKYAYTDFLDMVSGSNQLGNGKELKSKDDIDWKIPKINLS